MGCLINAFDFKEFFTKDFEYGDEEGQFSDNDISRAIQEADMNFNKDLLPDADKQRLLLLYLAAFYLVVDRNNQDTQGASNNGGLLTYRQVRNVAESFKVPKWIEENPMLSMFAQNGYGLKYVTMIYPYLIGNVGVVPGATLP